MALIPAVVLAILESGLRLLGYGYATSFFVHHPATGSGKLVENQRFAWRFTPRTLARQPEPVVLTPAKLAGTCRIFVFGESAAIGDPAPAFGFSRVLEVLLRERHPGIRFEVVNTAFTAINSHVIVPLARDCERLEGDFWLVYMGNNEVIGPFGTGTVFGEQSPPLPVIRASVALRASRLGQALDELRQRVRPVPEAALGWGGMSMFMSQQVRRDDPRLPVLHDHFQRNLADLMDRGARTGTRVLVSTMVSRVRDWPPFGSLNRVDLPEAGKVEWEKHYQAGVAAEATGNPRGALQSYEAAARLDDTHAELEYRRGTCHLALGQTTEAKARLELARDLDTLRFRTDSRLNTLIRQTVEARDRTAVRLIDAETAFAARSPGGLPGEEWLYEHVHFKFPGNYLLARLFAEELETMPPLAPTGGETAPGTWLSLEECAARLGYTESQRHEIARLMQRRFEEPIYRHQSGHAATLARAQQELDDLRAHGKPIARRKAADVCRQALERAPDDRILHELAARALGGIDDYEAAAIEWGQVARLIPHSALPYTELGKLEHWRGRTNEAAAWFVKAIEVNPDAAEAMAELGALREQQGSIDAAARYFRLALRTDPTRREAIEGLARLAPKSGKRRRPRRQTHRLGARE
ncbi:MAG: tetratricopeptide repeat protein [Limisphaerales bacterium]